MFNDIRKHNELIHQNKGLVLARGQAAARVSVVGSFGIRARPRYGLYVFGHGGVSLRRRQ